MDKIHPQYFKTAVVSGFFLLVSSWVTTGVITYIARHSPSIEEPFSFFDEIYDKPWTRLGPYIVGMAAGWLLTQDIAYKKIHKLVAALMWTLSMAVTFSLVYGLYGRNIGPLESAAHTALSHTTWGLAIAWIVLSCSTGRGGPVNWILSNRFFVPLSRLSFCAYLIHPLIMFAVFMHSDAPIHLTRDTMTSIQFVRGNKTYISLT
ncbi:hypothetical protein J437_LFUL002103 [Ladona fulva]|uniref:Nose resistant to fluoxetine protein 6 n=1 Tax=Ladona fulva TaxID=123851 RepID=A0A8K0K0T0_LADFU|nr:hypothetical protein J437_LFUL002103 [Ladona fulva]